MPRMLSFRPVKTSLIMPVLCFLGILSATAWYLVFLLTPAGDGRVVRVVAFPSGTSVKKLAAELRRSGIIRSSWHFILASHLRGEAQRLKAGDYRLSDAMTTTDILRKMVRGDVDFQRFTLPEGYSMYQAAELLQQKGFMTRGAFLDACNDRRLLAALGIRAASAEGYLFPATYNMTRGETAEHLVGRMTAHFEKMYSTIGASALHAGGMSRHEVITLASMIEKEAVFPSERPLISSVFHNRLRLGMRLQSDPTAVYGVKAFGGTVTKEDILRPSPYNTYLNPGLPPGPIGNPGADALRAALNPAETTYLYFVARQDGTHQFSRTLEEHNQSVRKYLKR